jgi:hypothetical protein
MLSARCRVTLSVALPGGNGTISVMRCEGYGSADAAGKDATRRSRTAAIPPVKLALKLITPSNGYWAASPSRIGLDRMAMITALPDIVHTRTICGK